jgi:hypothetical protein
MMSLVCTLAQAQALDDFQKALRDQIRQGGSVGIFLATLLGLMLFGLVAYAVAEWRRRVRLGPMRSDPQRVFVRLLDRLRLSRDQREWLQQVAAAARLKHPTVLLLVDTLFDQHAAAPSSPAAHKATPSPTKANLADLRRKLFAR